jgi:hypothetical protein
MEHFELSLREPSKEISAYLVYFLSEHLKTICDKELYNHTKVITEPWITPNIDNGTHLLLQPMEISKKYLNKTSRFLEIDSLVNIRVTALSNDARSLAFQILPKLESLLINAIRNMNGLDSLNIYEREVQYNRDLSGTMSICGFDLITNCVFKNYYGVNACQAYALLEKLNINFNSIMELEEWL